MRPTRNGEQVRKYIDRANNEDILIACAFVRRYKGFPHESRFHLIGEKVDQEDLQNARDFLNTKDEAEEFLLELESSTSLSSVMK